MTHNKQKYYEQSILPKNISMFPNYLFAEWIVIEDFPLYEICKEGFVRNKDTKKVLKNTIDYSVKTHPYKKIRLRKENGKENVRLHRLLAKTFIPNLENKPFIDHMDKDTLNNSLENLQWVTPKENAENSKTYKNNLLGVKGVQKRGERFRARIRHNTVLMNIGTFDTVEEASQAYLDKAVELFTNHGQ
jgi:hypothetical protein